MTWESHGWTWDDIRWTWGDTRWTWGDIVETEYREMLFRLETEHSDKELYWIIAQ